jgi:hypothetical protein
MQVSLVRVRVAIFTVSVLIVIVSHLLPRISFAMPKLRAQSPPLDGKTHFTVFTSVVTGGECRDRCKKSESDRNELNLHVDC